MSETITAMYDNRSDADAAADKLAEAGISRSVIQVVAGSESDYLPDAKAYDHSRDEGGFWATLKNFFLPDEDRYSYAEGMSRGSTVLRVTVEDERVGMASAIIEDYGAVDIQQRVSEWRAGGWSGFPGDGVPTTDTSAMPTASGMVTPEPTDPLVSTEEDSATLGRPEDRTARTTYGAAPSTTDGSDDPVLQAQNRPLDRPASTKAEGLFGKDMADGTDPAEIPVGSPGARADAQMGPGVTPKDVDDRPGLTTPPRRDDPSDVRRRL